MNNIRGHSVLAEPSYESQTVCRIDKQNNTNVTLQFESKNVFLLFLINLDFNKSFGKIFYCNNTYKRSV